MPHQRGQGKVHTVMREFKHGTLHSGSGGIVKKRKQAIAIALSEAGLSDKDKLAAIHRRRKHKR